MLNKTILSVSSPVTQTREAVVELLKALGRADEPLPEIVELANDVRLVLSKKKDVYYTTTPTACSCPASVYHPDQVCKHRKGLLEGSSREASRAQARAYQARQRELRAKAQAMPSMPEPAEGPRRLVVPPDHVSFKPFLEDGKRIDGYVAEVA
ncbi:MAG: hypothetical protein A4E48_01019 [Methanosaeta sp. PtaU1.Bin060]|nr:MAG: hypothetical protein A4E48_01019 [Methanosaeta sp. PtaU1.Bin060]